MIYSAPMAYNAQLAGVCPQLAESTKIAELANIHNGNYKELHLESHRSEKKLKLGEMLDQDG